MGEKGLRAVRRRNSGNPVVSGAGGLCLLFLVSLLRFRFLPFLPSCSILSSLPPSLHRASSLPPPSHLGLLLVVGSGRPRQKAVSHPAPVEWLWPPAFLLLYHLVAPGGAGWHLWVAVGGGPSRDSVSSGSVQSLQHPLGETEPSVSPCLLWAPPGPPGNAEGVMISHRVAAKGSPVA